MPERRSREAEIILPPVEPARPRGVTASRIARWATAAVLCVMSARLASQTTRPLTTRPASVAATAPATTAPASTAPTTGPSAAPAPTTAPVFPHADELLKALGSPDWHERRKTQELLVRGGEDARPLIEQLIQD